jgi:hypothetical protein
MTSKEIVAELRGVDNRPELAQIYLRHLCLRAADEIERLTGECRNWKQLRDADEACIADLQRRLRDARESRAAHEPPVSREPDGYAYRYQSLWDPKATVISFEERNQSVIESIPYWLGTPPASAQPPADEQLRAALVHAVEVIQTWHNMDVPAEQRSELWDIYWRNAPEMKPIRSALTKLPALDMSGQPMGDPHPVDLSKHGQCPFCGYRHGAHKAGCPRLGEPGE